MVALFTVGFAIGFGSSARADTITIMGSREGGRVVVVGEVSGFDPAVTFIPMYRLGGGPCWMRGIPFISDGYFSWTRKARKSVEVYVEGSNGVKSNTVLIRGVR